MLRSLFSGITGLRQHQTLMDVVGNNIANVNTAGFKSSSVVFEDTLSPMVRAADQPGERKLIECRMQNDECGMTTDPDADFPHFILHSSFIILHSLTTHLS